MTSEAGLIVSVSGIRGIVGAALTPEVASAFAAALGTMTKGGSIVLSGDGRPSGAMLRHAVLAGLLSTGCEVEDLGIAPTPTCGLAVRRLNARGGIQITASHNPAPWNGLKVFGPDGMVLPAEQGRELKALYESRAFRRAAWNEQGRLRQQLHAGSWHRQRVLELVDVEQIRAAGKRVFIDANGGAGGPLACSLLEALGCRIVSQACDADGIFQHEPEPVAANLQGVASLVARHGSAVGFVLDPDADRLALIDETGTALSEELTLALAVRFRLSDPASRGPVVINMSTSRLIEDIAQQAGVPCFRSAVGEANVAGMMRNVGAVIGGEGNGGVIDPRVGFVRDPFIGMGLILNLLTATGRRLSELVGDLPTYHIIKDKYAVERDRLPALFPALTQRWPEARTNTLDGLRLDWDDRWVHLRPSNTEPIVRVIAEAPRREDAEQLCREVGGLLL